MSVYFTGCLHLGHKNIGTFRDFVNDCDDNTDLIVRDWQKRIKKKDVVYCMGDTAFSNEAIDIIKGLPGRKILIKGNHDDFVSTQKQMEAFEEIYGMFRYKGMWLTHAPIHPDELRGKINVHAHVHKATIKKENLESLEKASVDDTRYINTCVDVIFLKYDSIFISLEQIKHEIIQNQNQHS